MRVCNCLAMALGGRGAAPSRVREPLNPSQGQEDAYRVEVHSFEVATRGRYVVYTLTVSRGSTQWPIRRRFRQVVTLHNQLIQGLGRSAMREGLPRLPPKVTYRQLACGQFSDGFLAARAARLQAYFEALLRYIPYVDQCEALHEFLCSPDVGNMSYDALIDLTQAVGNAPTSDVPVPPAAIAALPRRDPGGAKAASAAPSNYFCVICQESLQAKQDVRVLPCGHEYHYMCIAQWIPLKNACCVCQSMAVLPVPVPEQPEK